MATIDVARYLKPLSDDAPCGENLEYDPAFGALERAAQGKPEVHDGKKLVAKAEDPQWRDVFDQADALLGRSRDLRVAVHLTHAGLNLGGFSDLAAGLRVISGLLQESWDFVHPRVEDDNDPTLRINSILELESLPPPGTGQRPTLIRSLDRTFLVRSRQAGNFCHRDIKVAKGELALPDGEKALAPQLALIEAAFRECELADLQATAAAIGDAAATLKNLREYLSEKIGADRAPDFRVLTKELESMGRLLSEQLAHRGVATLPAGQQAAGMSAPSAVSEALGEVRTREDVVRILDKVSDYFEKYEPSSPVPLLLQRAKRLVAKDFMEILRDLTPAGVAQAEAIGGLDKHK